MRRTLARMALPLTVLLQLAGCAADWVNIRMATANSANATTVLLSLDTCHPSQNVVPREDVTESDTEVRVRLSMKQPSGDQDDCAGAVTMELQNPIGNRVVVDDRTGQQFTVLLPGKA
jgi:hypothetical protein